MTKRPRSSVTTILTNLVGRSVVSAITQTPASGPLGLVTNPPSSALPTRTVSLLLWPASNSVSITAKRATSTIDIPAFTALLLIVRPPSTEERELTSGHHTSI